MVLLYLLELQVALGALLRAVFAAGGEAAAGFGVDGVRDLALYDLPLAVAALERGDGDGGEEHLRVGVQRVLEELARRGLLDALAHVEHGDLVGDVLDDGEVVRDEHVGQAHLVLQVHQQVEYLRLDADVERGHGLITDDETGLHGERPGQAHALAAAAVQLMRIAVHQPGGQAGYVHQLAHAVLQIGLVLINLVDYELLGYQLEDRVARVQAGIGVLEDELHLLAQRTHLLFVIGEDVLALIVDLAGGVGLEPQDGAPQGGLAAARLANYAQRGALLDGKAHVVHGVEHTGAGLEVLLEVFDLQNGGVGVNGGFGFSRHWGTHLL